MFLKELNNLTVFVPKIAVHSCTGRTGFHTGRRKSLFNPVIAESTFACNFLHRMNKPAAIGTGLNAIPASDTVFFINKDDAFRTIVGGTYRTNLNTRRFGAMVAHFRDEEGFKDLLVRYGLRKSVDSTIG